MEASDLPKEIIFKLLIHSRLNQKQLEKKISAGAGLISKILAGDRGIGQLTANKIAKAFPEVSELYIRTGKGPFFKNQKLPPLGEKKFLDEIHERKKLFRPTYQFRTYNPVPMGRESTIPFGRQSEGFGEGFSEGFAPKFHSKRTSPLAQPHSPSQQNEDLTLTEVKNLLLAHQEEINRLKVFKTRVEGLLRNFSENPQEPDPQ